MDPFLPVQKFADYLTYSVFNLAPKTHLSLALNFFIYDVLKISLLLVVIGYLMAITRYYFPMQKVRNILLKKGFLA